MVSLNLLTILFAWGTLFNLLSLAAADNNNPTDTSTSTSPSERWATNDTITIDTFQKHDTNDLGFWHGSGEGLPVEFGPGFVRLFPSDPDQNFHTQLTEGGCVNLSPLRDRYLHVVFSGTMRFGISLNQNNAECSPSRNPYPATWDTVEAGRYAVGNEIFVPLDHFWIDQERVVSVSFSGFYTRESLVLYLVEIVREIPERSGGWFGGGGIPAKVPSGTMVMRCSRPNSFAFGIDDGQPQFAQKVMEILREEGILVTFFVVGAGLRDEETNFTAVYREMLRRGHQVALHSNTHKKMEALETIAEIDDEIIQGVWTFKDKFGITSRYFRPPFGTVGARMRQRLAALIHDPYIVNWSVDIEDWLWGKSEHPEKQVEAFIRDVRRGGNLAVMHYLHESTLRYFTDIIHFVKSTGMDIMRVDQCLEDPESPPFNAREQKPAWTGLEAGHAPSFSTRTSRASTLET